MVLCGWERLVVCLVAVVLIFGDQGAQPRTDAVGTHTSCIWWYLGMQIRPNKILECYMNVFQATNANHDLWSLWLSHLRLALWYAANSRRSNRPRSRSRHMDSQPLTHLL